MVSILTPGPNPEIAPLDLAVLMPAPAGEKLPASDGDGTSRHADDLKQHTAGQALARPAALPHSPCPDHAAETLSRSQTSGVQTASPDDPLTMPISARPSQPIPRSEVPSRQRTANKRSKGPTAVLAIGPLTCYLS